MIVCKAPEKLLIVYRLSGKCYTTLLNEPLRFLCPYFFINSDTLWEILEPIGTKKPLGAFYFLIPSPSSISDEEAVDILANKFGLLLMPGESFGALGSVMYL
jgi:hypothetical protein